MLSISTDSNTVIAACQRLQSLLKDPTGGILVQADDDGTTFRAFNEGVDARVTLDAKINSPGRIRLPPIFVQLVGTMSGDFELSETTTGAHVECGTITADLRTFAPDGWMPFKFCEVDLVEAPDFGEAIRVISPFTAKAPRAPLDGVHLGDGFARGTNNYTLAQYPLDIPIDEPITMPFGPLTRILEKGGTPAFAVEKNKFYIHDGDTEIITAIYADKYPKLDRIQQFMDDAENTISFDAGEALKSLRRMRMLSKSEEVARVKLELENGQLTMSTTVPDLGYMADEFEFTGDNVTHTATLSPEYLTNALSGCGDKPEVSFSIPEEVRKSTPWVFRNPNTGFVAVVMPLVT